ncbi:MAG TPA: type II secretion system protein [Geothrix sp.]|jgi:prepilin-type N-terminal cleavage/methylation domain-containing protein
MATLRPPARTAGYTLIELLVVLAIIGILGAVGFYSFGPKSPRAVRSALIDIRGAIQQARQLALSGGKDVDLILTPSGGNLTIKVYVSGDVTPATGAPVAGAIPLMDVILGDAWKRNASLVATYGSLPASLPSSVTAAIQNAGMAASTWTTANSALISSTQRYGFSSSSLPQVIDNTTGARSPLLTGTWIGVVGNGINQKGAPYGVVVITSNATVSAYYKADAGLEDASSPKEMKWQRLD